MCTHPVAIVQVTIASRYNAFQYQLITPLMGKHKPVTSSIIAGIVINTDMFSYTREVGSIISYTITKSQTHSSYILNIENDIT